METWLPIILQVIGGAVGGNAAGAGMKGKSLGAGGNSVVGALGGLGLGQLLPMLGLGDGAAATDITSILTDLVGGGAGGAILTAIAGMLFKGNKT